jgi:hypothetical protein
MIFMMDLKELQATVFVSSTTVQRVSIRLRLSFVLFSFLNWFYVTAFLVS